MKTMIFAIAKNQWKYKSRPRRREIPFYLSEHECEDESSFPEASEMKLYETIIWSEFKKLPDTCRRVILLSCENYNNIEIARELNCTEGYIGMRKSTCLQRFITALKNHKSYKLLRSSQDVLNIEIKET